MTVDTENAPDFLPNIVTKIGGEQPSFAGSEDLVKYVLVQLDVPRQFHEAFQGEMRKLTELMYDYKRWELVFAAYPITGEVSRFVHIWKIPSEATILEVMRQGALAVTVPPLPQNPGKTTPERLAKYNTEYNFRSTYQSVQSMVVRTNHILLTSLSYDPENIGFQTQTILVDANENLFLIYHRDLHDTKHRLKKLTHELETIRLKDEIKRYDGINVPAASADEARFTSIHRLLTRGITDATLERAKSKDRDLLFNLAGLRPKTIFEDLTKITVLPQAAKGEEASPVPKGLTFPKGVKALLLAMPDGNVYQADLKALQDLAKPIPPSKYKPTKALIDILVERQVPLASIPNDRHEVVGDGCACYVINLSSFGPPEK